MFQESNVLTDSEKISKLQYSKYRDIHDLTTSVDVNLVDLCMEMRELFDWFIT